MRTYKATQCGRVPDTKECYVEELGLTEDELVVLTAARLYFQSFSEPSGQTWVASMSVAEQHFGFEQGPRISARLLALPQTVRRSRRSMFMFNSPACAGCATLATEHERRLMSGLVSLRKGDSSRAQMEFLMLCEGNDIEDVMAANAALVLVMGGHSLEAVEARAPARVLQ